MSKRVIQPVDLIARSKNGAPRVNYAAEPYLIEHCMHFLVGDGDAGKSFLALDAAVGLATGTYILGDVKVTRPYRVIFVDEDSPNPDTSSDRALLLMEGRGVKAEAVKDNLLIYPNNMLTFGCEELKDIFGERNPEFVIFDCFRALFRGDENSNQVVALELRGRLRPLMKRYSFGAIVTHHTNRENPDSIRFRGKRPRIVSNASRGATDIRNTTDVMFGLQVISGAAHLVPDKMRLTGKSRKPPVTAYTIGEVLDDEGEQTAAIIERVPVLAYVAEKGDAAHQDILSLFPESGKEELARKEILAKLKALSNGWKKYKERWALAVLAELALSHLKKRQEGKYVYYSRK